MTDMTTARAFPGRLFPGQGRSLSTAWATPPLDTLIAIPFDTAGDFDAIATLLKYSEFGTTMRAGIYDSGPDGLPNSLVEDAGERELSMSQGSRFVEMMFSCPLTLTEPYWVVALFGGTTAPGMLASAPIPALEAQKIFGIFTHSMDTGLFHPPYNAVSAPFSYAPLPATFPTPSLTTSTLWLSVRSTL